MYLSTFPSNPCAFRYTTDWLEGLQVIQRFDLSQPEWFMQILSRMLEVVLDGPRLYDSPVEILHDFPS